ncbi:MAG: hypothetical protein HOC71_13550 [Candidatus Latescibacteria bacterium]|jgi:hypothetical protein|nr:hypothetical protein [Candidatus Latescibacterota bacterium]
MDKLFRNNEIKYTFDKFYFGAMVIGYLTGIEKLVEISSDFLESYCIATPGKVSGNIILRLANTVSNQLVNQKNILS